MHVPSHASRGKQQLLSVVMRRVSVACKRHIDCTVWWLCSDLKVATESPLVQGADLRSILFRMARRAIPTLASNASTSLTVNCVCT